MTFITLYFYSIYVNFDLVTTNVELAFTRVWLSKVNILCMFLSPFFCSYLNMAGVNVSVA